MISGHDLYTVLSAVVPLYVAMILAYGSVRWWKILTPEQCGGINRFVAIFAVPLLSFHIIANNDPYKMNVKFIAADGVQKTIILLALGLWARFSRHGSLEWMITLFMLATLPNTLVMGIPLLAAMYGVDSGNLVVQAVVLQCIIWYTLLLFFYEYRSARILISQQFPETAASIISFKIESDVISLDGREPLQTEAEIGDDGKIHVTVRKSVSSHHSMPIYSYSPNRRSIALRSMPSSKALTPRPSNLTGADIYSMHSSRNLTPRESNFNHNDFYSFSATGNGNAHHPNSRPSNFTNTDVYSLHSSRGPTPRTSNFNNNDDISNINLTSIRAPSASVVTGSSPRFHMFAPRNSTGTGDYAAAAASAAAVGPYTQLSPKHNNHHHDVSAASKASPHQRANDDLSKDLHMFVWSSSASPVSEAYHGPALPDNTKPISPPPPLSHLYQSDVRGGTYDEYDRDDFSFGNRASFRGDESMLTEGGPSLTKMGSSSTTELAPKVAEEEDNMNKTEMPPTSVMSKLILNMVWRKLVRNPNTYSSLLGLTWALISYRWNIPMPVIVEKSISILSSAGLGMAMFSLGLFMALQKRLLACGTSLALYGMVVRFLTGPAVMAASSIAVGLRGVELKVSIVQAALPQGIVPFVFAKEYNVHPDILSTAVIFGMLVSLPITLLYYLLLGL